jgi:hypothetical protein
MIQKFNAIKFLVLFYSRSDEKWNYEFKENSH